MDQTGSRWEMKLAWIRRNLLQRRLPTQFTKPKKHPDPLKESTGPPEIPAAKNQLGLSENSVPLNPMVNDHYPY